MTFSDCWTVFNSTTMSNNAITLYIKNFYIRLFLILATFQSYLHYNDCYWNFKNFLKYVTSFRGSRDLWQFVTGEGSKIAKNSVTSFMDGPLTLHGESKKCFVRGNQLSNRNMDAKPESRAQSDQEVRAEPKLGIDPVRKWGVGPKWVRYIPKCSKKSNSGPFILLHIWRKNRVK